MVVPTLESAGTNVKVLEALAMERAVVSTPSGCAGLGLEHGKTAWIADIGAGSRRRNYDAARRCQRCAPASPMPAATHAKKHFDWRAIGRRQRALLRELAGDPLILRTRRDRTISTPSRAFKPRRPAPPSGTRGSYLRFRLPGRRTAVGANRKWPGFLSLAPTAPGEREILNLAVDPGTAPGKRRDCACSKHELNRGEGSWFLEVRESNGAAIRLYLNSGFRVAGRRENYYNNPPEAGIVMRFLS